MPVTVPGARHLAPYVRLFSVPGTRAFTVGSWLARWPMGIFGISAVIMIADTRGSYALAGAVTATGLVGTAVVGPMTARLVDRYGQARIALPASLITVTGAVSLAACVRSGAPDWTLFAGFLLMSTMPNTGGMSRARWTHLFRTDPAARHTSNSFEQVADELCFLTGPPLGAMLCTQLFVESGILTGATLLLTGMLIFVRQRSTEPPVERRTGGRKGGGRKGGAAAPPLQLGALVPLLLTFLCLGTVFGSTEVATIAFADERGQPAAAGFVLAVHSVGSAVASLYLGSGRPPEGSLVRRFALAVCGMAALALVTFGAAASGSLWLLAAALLVAGLGTAPAMVTGMTLVQETVPEARLNEGMTWAVTGLVSGVAAGSGTGGWAAEHLPHPGAFTVPPTAALLAAVVASAALVRVKWRARAAT